MTIAGIGILLTQYTNCSNYSNNNLLSGPAACAAGYAPATTIETGVERFVAWYRAHYAGPGGPAA